MRIAIDLLHPAHVHVFRPFIEEMTKRGHELQLFSRVKDVTVELLDAAGLEHTVLSTQRAGVTALGSEMMVRCARLYRALRRNPPDVMLGIMGPAIAVVGKAFPDRKTIGLYDTESASKINRIVSKLVDAYCTPRAFTADGGPNHLTYPGYHELAYLHPNRFTPKPELLRDYGLDQEELFLLRFVAWESIHDVGESGLSLKLKRQLISTLSKRGRVVISSENELPAEFEPYRLRIAPEHIHHVLANTSLLIGESSTMASEAAVLGAHAFFVSKTGRGVNDEQESRYGINHCFNHQQDAAVLDRLNQLLELPNLRADALERRARLLEESVDLTTWLIELVEGSA